MNRATKRDRVKYLEALAAAQQHDLSILFAHNVRLVNLCKVVALNVGLALNASHNTVTTDLPEVEPTETSWRIDHTKEIKLIDQLQIMIDKMLGKEADHAG